MTAKLATRDDRVGAGVEEDGALRDGSILLHSANDKPQLGRIQLGCGYLSPYFAFVGGATNVTPGLTSAPGLDSILVDSAGDVIITGQAGTNPMLPPFPQI